MKTKTQALARLKVSAANPSKVIELEYGAYFGREEPLAYSETGFDDFVELKKKRGEDPYTFNGKPALAIARGYNVKGDSGVFVWVDEVPKLIKKFDSMRGLLAAAPAIFSHVGGSGKMRPMGDYETALCYQGPGGFVTIVLNND
jgi:hypothetical protein